MNIEQKLCNEGCVQITEDDEVKLFKSFRTHNLIAVWKNQIVWESGTKFDESIPKEIKETIKKLIYFG